MNFPIFVLTSAAGLFHADARGYGLLSPIMATGTVAGALPGQSGEAKDGGKQRFFEKKRRKTFASSGLGC